MGCWGRSITYMLSCRHTRIEAGWFLQLQMINVKRNQLDSKQFALERHATVAV